MHAVAQYDLAMKRLTSVFTRDYARFALGADSLVGWRDIPGGCMTVMTCPCIQWWWCCGQEGCWRVGGIWVVTWGQPVASCWFKVIAWWEVDAAAVMDQQLTGLYPLLPLMRWERATDPAAILEQTQRLILDEIEPLEARADAYVGLRVLSAISYPSELVQQILQRRELMLESPAYREIREEGWEEALREAVLAALEVRFGAVPLALTEQVQRRERTKLEGLLRRAIVVESLETFARELE
jgi:hypothetical protein